MPSKTVVETWEKATTPRTTVDSERRERLNSGATSSAITDDATNWILTTQWPVIPGKGS